MFMSFEMKSTHEYYTQDLLKYFQKVSTQYLLEYFKKPVLSTYSSTVPQYLLHPCRPPREGIKIQSSLH